MAPARPIRALLGAFDISFLSRLRSDLDKQPDIKLACALRDAEILELTRELQPDVLLMDSGADNPHSTSLLEEICANCAHTKVILFLDGHPEDSIVDALERGVRGCLLKNCSRDDCVRAIRAVHAGDMWVGRKALAQLLENLRTRVQTAHTPAAAPIPGLTAREAEVVVKIKLGLTNKEVARQLGISETTVKTHLQHVFHKLRISRRVELWRGALVSASGHRLMR